jgi:glycosyltransferase involved in cell wall biosynthesis
MSTGPKVCMLVYNVCTSDARVLKEATSLTQAGADVTVVAVLDKVTVAAERRDGFQIVRIDRNPPHYKLLRGARKLRRRIQLVPRLIRLRLARRAAAQRRRHGRAGTRPVAPPRRLAKVALGPLTVALLAAERLAIAVVGTADKIASPVGYRTVMLFHKPLLYADYYRQAYRLVAGSGFDVVHAHDLNTLPAAWLAARRLGMRVVYDSHELYPEVSTLSRRERAIWRVLERRMIGTPESVVTVCESIADELARRYPIERPTVLLNSPPRSFAVPADDGVSPLRAMLGDSCPDGPIVLYQGGFAPNRGLAELVLASGMLDRGKLVLMGWGLLEAELQGMIDENDLHERAVIVAPVAQSEVVAHAGGADVGVIPYQPIGLNNRYTTPNKLFDYMAAGIAIAGTRLPELERFVEGHSLGALFDSAEPEPIAAALNGLLADPVELGACQARSRQAGKVYSWEREAGKLLALYGLTAASDTSDDPSEPVASNAPQGDWSQR